MTEQPSEHAAPSPSLVQQRLSVQRVATLALIQLVITSVLTLGWVAVIIVENGDRTWSWISAAAFAAFAVFSAFRLRSARRSIRTFDEENGPDGGRH